ncbi:Bug family tripartite tricarboxylate transporter substrate binding protein [Falsiroseomonas stagni]|uniref:Tripartite-type tricarboxylate transporter, receptor component TctC n=1 Tax=Falsiroseomonas stagni DSM 19981 TaxID=1123062 RepID=A0A1I4B3A3_9PROT|nr:tripartite tricarboxylate transporter substrate binding protein [Falsiroseomonas stagni]SFK62531.1 Tripartite-type tricarboxylate transporter, receptor component TctC [Falsiroseomonas stagni DSM 19981]
MRFTRRAALAASITALACPALAQSDFPNRPIRVIVPSAPGGSLDILARLIARHLGERLGWQVPVENRSGGGGNIGFDAVAKARPDGYTVLIASEPLAVNPSLFRTLPFDPIRDFQPLTMIATLSQVLVVHPSVPARNFAEFVALARSGGPEINIGSAGTASPGHMAVAQLVHARVPLTHVPYRGGGPAVQDTVAGNIQGGIMTLPAALPFMQSGQVRALAVTSSRRSPFAPDVPAMAEALPDVVVDSWQALLLPAGVPAEVLRRLHTEITAVIRLPEVDEFLKRQAFEPAPGTPDELGALIRAEVPKWRRVVQETGLRLD